jgi:hypothetical protein
MCSIPQTHGGTRDTEGSGALTRDDIIVPDAAERRRGVVEKPMNLDLPLILGFPLASIWALLWHRLVAQDGVSAADALALIVVVAGVFLALHLVARPIRRG